MSNNNNNDSRDAVEYIERLVSVRRVAKTTKGGRNMSFAAHVVVGDGKGLVGAGYGKAREVPAAVDKAVKAAKKNFFKAPMINGTISHPVLGKKAAGEVFLRPASPGTGVIAGGPVRAVLEAAGYTDVLTKNHGSSNSLNIVNATIDALKQLEMPESVAVRRGLPLEHVSPARLIQNLAKENAQNSSEVTNDLASESDKSNESPVESTADKKADSKKPTAKKTDAKKAETTEDVNVDAQADKTEEK